MVHTQAGRTLSPSASRTGWAGLFGLGLILAAFPDSAAAASWCVNPAVNTCKATIGAAIAAAAPNDVITVVAGTYKESVTIGKPLVLMGSDAAKTIIDATGQGTGIFVDGINNKNLANVFVSGFTVQNANFEGILVANASSVTIANNIVTGNDKSLVAAANQAPSCPGLPAFETAEAFDCGEGLHVMGIDHSTIAGNTVSNNAGGILITDETAATHDNVFAGNVVSNNPFDCGITVASHPPSTTVTATGPFGIYRNTIINNQVSQNGLKGEGAGVGLFSPLPGGAVYSNVVLNNVLTGNGLPGVAMHGHTPQQNFNDNVIVGNQISGNGADTDDALTAGPTGINLMSVTPVTGTVVTGNIISGEAISVAWNAPGLARVNHNSFASRFGVINLGAGTVNADGNFWGCNSNPTDPFAALFSGCALTTGAVSVSSWLPAAFTK